VEAFGEEVVAVLDFGDGEVAAFADHFRLKHVDGEFAVEDLIHGGGAEAGLEAGGAEHRLLADGDAFEGEEFLGVLGLVDGDEVLFEVGDALEVFEADDGVAGCGESMFDGVAGGTGLAFRGARPGGFSGVGAVGGALFGGDGLFGSGQREKCLSETRGSMRAGARMRTGAVSVWGQRGIKWEKAGK